MSVFIIKETKINCNKNNFNVFHAIKFVLNVSNYY